MQRRVRRIALLLTLVSLQAAAGEELDRAREVFREALVLEVAGDWASALAKYQEVGRTRLTPQVRYHLARCKEHLGRLTEALGDYRVAEDAARAGGLEETNEMERARRELEGRVPRLVIHSRGIGHSTTIEIDGVVLGSRVLEVPFVVNPGWHQVARRDPQGGVREFFVNAEEGRLTEINLAIGDLSVSTLPEGQSLEAPTPRARAPQAWAYVSAGLGIVAVASSIVLFAVKEHAESKLADECPTHVCRDGLRPVYDRGRVAAVAAPITLGVGVAAIGLATWGIWGQNQVPDVNRGRSRSATITAAAAPGSWGVTIAAPF